MLTRRRLLALALLGGLTPVVAQPRAVPAWLEERLPGARLAGSGTFRWLGLRIYEARLWVGRRFEPEDPLRHPLALELEYARNFEGRSIARRSVEEMERLFPADALPPDRWEAAMRRVFPDVGEGRVLAGVHQPGVAAEFLLDGRPTGRIDDPAFGPAFFAIWLDARTREPALRERLLAGLRAPR